MTSEERIDAARDRSWIATGVIALLMMVAVVVLYLPRSVLTGEQQLTGTDHILLHARRMEFAREHLFGPAHRLPAWYPRELMGAPFRANLQNFPWIPTRLIVLWLVDPQAALGLSAALSAALAALFTMLFCRRLRMGRVASAAAGWTFACAGFYASRVFAGHLPLLEAYPALPALLWLTDRVLGSTDRRARRIDWPLLALAAASLCFALSGHPQLSVYGLAFASLYALGYGRNAILGRGGQAVLAMLFGVGMAAFALYPMALLTGRSTRVLPLDRAVNDLAMPYKRLGALVFPWRDGWPAAVHRRPQIEFAGYPHPAYFWDTVCYVGWAPLLAALTLAALVVLRRVRLGRRGVLIALMGISALGLSLPVWQDLLSNVPGTFLRSPARLMYVVGFALAIALGSAMDELRRLSSSIRMASFVARFAPGLVVALVLALHVADLGSHARSFLVAAPLQRGPFTSVRELLLGALGEGRAGVDFRLDSPVNRTLDDIGFYDSLILAKPYRFVLDTSGLSERTNVQMMDAGQMSLRTLRAGGVRVLWTRATRADLELLDAQGANIYAIRDPEPRTAFLPTEQVQFMSDEQIHRVLRDPSIALAARLYLPLEHKPAALREISTGALTADVLYRRPGSDEIVVDVTSNQAGYVRLLESWDSGWSATVDGTPAPVLAGNDAFITVPMPQGKHELRLIYRTPGAMAGAVISIVSAGMLVALALSTRRCHRGD